MTKPNTRISVSGLSKRFNREWIFRDFSYTFEAGKSYVLVGPNGSGKSTLLQVLAAYTPQSSGSLSYFSTEGKSIPVEEIYNSISLVAPYLDLIDEFTLVELLQFHFRMKPLRSGHKVEDLLSILYLENARDKYFRNFSSGMRQRVKLGLALYTQADIYFIDEPGTNLDEQAFEWYLKEFAKIPTSSTVILASNNRAEFPLDAEIIRITDFKR